MIIHILTRVYHNDDPWHPEEDLVGAFSSEKKAQHEAKLIAQSENFLDPQWKNTDWCGFTAQLVVSGTDASSSEEYFKITQKVVDESKFSAHMA